MRLSWWGYYYVVYPPTREVPCCVVPSSACVTFLTFLTFLTMFQESLMTCGGILFWDWFSDVV
jgi:hypothetical protein